MPLAPQGTARSSRDRGEALRKYPLPAEKRNDTPRRGVCRSGSAKSECEIGMKTAESVPFSAEAKKAPFVEVE